jgi:beta-mannosidase
MDFRQHHPNGTQQLQAQLRLHLGDLAPPGDGPASRQHFARWIWAAQVVQSVCTGTETAYYRSARALPSRTMGALYWQFNSVWSAFSWSSLEFGHTHARWKLLHNTIERAFRPLAVFALEVSPGQITVFVVNDAADGAPFQGRVEVSAIRWSDGASVQNTSSGVIDIPPSSSTVALSGQLGTLLGTEITPTAGFLRTTLRSAAGNVFHDLVPCRLGSAEVPTGGSAATVTVSCGEVDPTALTAECTVTASASAVFVTLETALPGRFSENGYIVLPGDSKSVTFFGWEPYTAAVLNEGLTVRHLHQQDGHDAVRRP